MTALRWEHILGVALDQIEQDPAALDVARETLRQLRGVAAVHVDREVKPIGPLTAWREPAWVALADGSGRWFGLVRYSGPNVRFEALAYTGTVTRAELYDEIGDPIGWIGFGRPVCPMAGDDVEVQLDEVLT